MKNILVAIDFSHSTELILNQAIEAAKAFSAKLWIIHVASNSESQIGLNLANQDMPGLMVAGGSYYNELLNVEVARERIANELQKEHAALLDYSQGAKEEGLKVQALLLEGSEADVIIKESKKKEIDLIVMGSHGHGLVHKALVGSISEAVIKNGQTPVLIVPSK